MIAQGAMNEPSTKRTGRGRRKALISAVLAALIAALLFLALRGGNGGEPERAADRGAGRAAPGREAVALAADLRRRAFLDSLRRIPVLTVDVGGTVWSALDGSGIPGAAVTLASSAGRFLATAGPDGAWSARIPAGVYRVSARAAGHVDLARAPLERLPGVVESVDRNRPSLALAPVVVADSDRGGVDLFLVPGARVHGTVRDRAGDPVAGVVVRGAGFEGLDRAIRVAAGTDADVTGPDGAYAIDVPIGPVLVDARHGDYAGLEREEDGLVFAGPGEDIALDLVLTEGCAIAGTVVGGRGGTLHDGAIERWIGGPPPVDFRPAGRFEDGRFRYATTDQGLVRLRAWPWKAAPSPALEFECRPGARYDDVVLVVPDAEPDLAGVVVTLDGDPVPGAHIDIMPLDIGGLPQQERADDRGEWAVFTQPAGRYVVTAFVPDEGAASERVRVPSRDVRLVLRGTGAVRGTVSGVQTGGFTLSIDRCHLGDDPWPVLSQLFESSPARVVTVTGGRFLVDDLPACRIEATAVAAGRFRSLSFTVVADETVEIELDFGGPDPEP
jgi:hypothetical protein